MKRFLPSLLAMLVAAGCASKPKPKLMAGALLTPLEADREFSRLAMQIPPAEAFARYTDPRSVQLVPVGPPIVGRDAIQAGMQGMPPGTLEWRPQGGETAMSGELAWTWGDYLLHAPGGDRAGKYLSIWHRTPDGHWMLAVDIDNLAPQPR